MKKSKKAHNFQTKRGKKEKNKFYDHSKNRKARGVRKKIEVDTNEAKKQYLISM